MFNANIDILEFVYNHPDHAVDGDTLRAFIGENAERRAHDLVRSQQLHVESDWFGDGRRVYTLGPVGENLLAQHRQELEKLAEDVADKQAQRELVTRREKRKARSEWARFWLGLAIGWILGAFTPVDAWKLVVKVYHAFVALFQ
jgi:hypothetical protein